MTDNDDLTRRLDGHEVRILAAIGEVKQQVIVVSEKVQETAVVVARLEERSLGQKGRLDTLEGGLEGLKRSDRIVGSIAAIVGATVGSVVAIFTKDR